MTLNELIREAASASHQISTGDIPIKLNGKEITDAKFRLHLDGDCVMYCDMILEHDEDIIPEEEAYQNGYLAGLKERLTWEDAQLLHIITEKYMRELDNSIESFPSSSEELFEEILRRFHKKGVELGRKIEMTRIGAQIKENHMIWEDVKRIVEIADSLLPYASVKHADLEHEFQSEEDYYKEVLKRYNGE